MTPQAARTSHLELADIVRSQAAPLAGLTPAQQDVLRALATCRTAALGGHVHQCDHCGHQEISHNSCRDRHCPKCQGLNEVRWVDAQQQDLLPVQYFHVVYAHRIAISNDRLVSLQAGQVTFRWKDRAQGTTSQLATLDTETFLRRFLLHVLPRGFVRIRHYGFLANSVRREQLATVRTLLGQPAAAVESPTEPEPWEALLRLTGKDVTQCPRCGVGRFFIIEVLPAGAVSWELAGHARSP